MLWRGWCELWKLLAYTDSQVIVLLLRGIDITTAIAYTLLFNPVEEFVCVDWFYHIFFFAYLPSHLLLTAGRYTLQSFYGGRSRKRRRTRNLRLRIKFAYLSSGRTVVQLPMTLTSFHTGEHSHSSEINPTSTDNSHSSEINPTSTDIDAFLSTFDPLRHFHVINDLSVLTLPSRYKSICHGHPQFQRILLEAKLLQSTLRHYNQVIPLHTPTIYVSTVPEELPIVIDTGASCSVTPNPLDFTEVPTTADIDKMEGLSGQTAEVVGVGKVLWDIEDCKGIRDALETTAYLVPSANIRLFSPQIYVAEQAAKKNTHCKLVIDTEGAALTLANGTILRFPIAKGSNLPFMLTHKGVHPQQKANLTRHVRRMNRFDNLVSFLCSSAFNTFTQTTFNPVGHALPTIIPNKLEDSPAVLSRTNWNISEPQQELLLWHYRLGHINMQHVQSLLAKPRDHDSRRIIHPRNNKSSHCIPCLCEACQYAKQKRREPPSTHKQVRPENEGALSQNIIIPGQRVSVDLYQSSTKGRLPYTFGKEKESHQYTAGALFLDHATRLIHHTHQFSTTASETINSKHRFEQYCDSFGVKVREYIGDNNPFHSQDWKDDCANQNQVCGYSGVGAHHQNKPNVTSKQFQT